MKCEKCGHKVDVMDLETELKDIQKQKQMEVLKEDIDFDLYKNLHNEECRVESLILGISRKNY